MKGDFKRMIQHRFPKEMLKRPTLLAETLAERGANRCFWWNDIVFQWSIQGLSKWEKTPELGFEQQTWGMFPKTRWILPVNLPIHGQDP